MDTLETMLRGAAPTEPDVLALVGMPPHGSMMYDGLGLFTKCADRQINGAPSYSLVGSDNAVLLWRAGAAADVAWFVGSRGQAGKAHGNFRARDAPMPDGAAVSWEIVTLDGTSWVEAPDIRCISGDAVQTELDAATPLIALVGSTPQNLQRDCLGLFELIKGQLVNGYPLYALVGSEGRDLLWHVGSSWIVGNRPDLGKNVGGMIAYDGALRPESVRAPWAVMGLREEWVEAPEVEVILGPKLGFELSSAARTIALVGTTPRASKSGFLGIFERLPRTVNGVATYRMAATDPDAPPVLLWHANACWLVGSMSTSRRDAAQLRVSDGALRPECIEATWEVWDDRDESWVEAPALRCLPKHAVVQVVEEVELKADLVRRLEANAKAGANAQRMRRTTSAVGRLSSVPRASKPGAKKAR